MCAVLVCPACSTIFLIAIGIGGVAAAGGGLAAILLDAALLEATLLEATLPGAALARGSAGAGAVAATGSPPEPSGATTVAPGPANTRFTFKLVSGSIMTPAYSFRPVTCWMSTPSVSSWHVIPPT